VNSNTWKEVATNKTRTTKTTTVQQLPLPIPTIMSRYAALKTYKNHVLKHHRREYDNTNVSQERYGRAPNYKSNSDEKTRKIIFIGDSHARGCAQVLQHYLGHNFVVQGFVKPGANL
jgi:hypothetical protein